jgi:hypothetical protein
MRLGDIIIQAMRKPAAVPPVLPRDKAAIPNPQIAPERPPLGVFT